MGGWDRLISIRDSIRRNITLEFLISFSFDHPHSDFDNDDTICFRALSQYYCMCLTQFSVILGLYDRDYVHMEEYAQLPVKNL